MPDRITATGWRHARTRILSADNTVRKVTLPEGRYLLFGDSTGVVRFTTRIARADGALAPGETGEPAAAEMAAATVDVPGPPEMPADAGAYRFIHVSAGAFLNLYVTADAARRPKLVGPVTWDFSDGVPVG